MHFTSIKIGNKEISDTSPTFIIAEAACNHMCNITLAMKLIDEAKASGADAIKFQTYKAEHLVCENSPIPWKYKTQVRSQFEYYKNLDKFERPHYKKLFLYAQKKGIIAFSTPFDIESASMLNDIGAPLFKIGSCDVRDVRLIRHIAKFNKPLIISTGATTLEEIQKTTDLVLSTGNNKLILLVSTMSYPTAPQDAHLNRILEFKKYFRHQVIGYSDHTSPDDHMIIPSIAVALGAKVYEKHFTLDRKMEGSGHSFSTEPKDFKEMIKNIRLTEMVLGNSEIKVYSIEEAVRKNARRSLVARIDIKKGTIITDELIAIKRPGTGIPSDKIDLVIGKTALDTIKKDTQISFGHLKSG